MPRIVTLTLSPTVDVTWRVDQLEPVGKNRARTHSVVGGGGGVNVARGVVSLGGGALAVHTAGGHVGRRLGRLLDEEGLDHRGIEVAEETREAMILLVGERGESYHVVPSGPPVGDAQARACIDAVLDEVVPGGYLVLSGSLPEGTPVDLYAEVVRRTRAADVRVVLDTSGPALGEALDEGVFLVKPNKREAAELIGRRVETFDAAREVGEGLLDRGGAQVVVTTLGAHGALCSTASGHHAVHSPPLPGPARSDAGAGDSLVAGIVAALAGGDDPVAACARGVAAAAASVLTPGTELFDPGEVERLRPEVAVESVTAST